MADPENRAARVDPHVQTFSSNGHIPLIFLSSWLMLTMVFPDYLAESREGAIAFLESMNFPEAQLEVQIEKLDDATPLNQASSGLIGIFQRKK